MLTAHDHSRPQSLRSFWPAAGIESSGSNHFEITKEITEFCPSGLIKSSSMTHARNGYSQSSRFLPQARRIVGSGDENGTWQKLSSWKVTSSDSMISGAIKPHTNEHTVRGRPTLKVVTRFRKGSVCKAYERSTIYEQTFWVNLSRIMLCQRS